MKRKRKKFGDRKEGRLLHSIPAFNRIVPFFLPTRAGSSVYFEETVRIDEIDEFLRSLRVLGYGGIDMMHYAIACYLHTLAMYPGINRFVAGQKIYARNTIEVGMTVKRGMALDSGETTIKICFEPNDTLIDVYNNLCGALGIEREPIFGPPRAGDIRDSNADISKAREKLGYDPSYDFKAGITLAINWYREHL